MACLTVSAVEEKRLKGLGFVSNRDTDNFSARVVTLNGRVTAEQSRCITEAAEIFGNGTLTFTSRLSIEVPGIPYEKVEEFSDYIAKVGLYPGGTGPKVRPVVSCKGTTCRFGLIDTFALSEELHNRFYKGYREVKLHHKFKIGVGGCPNNCIKPDLNDLGIVGQRIPKFNIVKCKECNKCFAEEGCPPHAAKFVDGALQIDEEDCINCGRCIVNCPFDSVEEEITGYKVYIGGRWGKKVSIGQPLDAIFVDQEDLMNIIEKTIDLYKEQGQAGERLSQTLERIGFENFQSQLLEGILAR